MRWHDYDGAMTRLRWCDRASFHLHHCTIAIAPSLHCSVDPNKMVHWCDSELLGPIRIPYLPDITTSSLPSYHRIIALLRPRTIAIAQPHHHHCSVVLRSYDGAIVNYLVSSGFQSYKIFLKREMGCWGEKLDWIKSKKNICWYSCPVVNFEFTGWV